MNNDSTLDAINSDHLQEVIGEFPETPLAPEALADLALAIQVERMERFGNVLSADHRKALDITHGKFAAMLHGRPGRWAFNLECGVGKTQAAISFVLAAHQLGLLGPAGKSLVICCAQIEALCAIKRDLSRAAPGLRVGLAHRSSVDPLSKTWTVDEVSGLPLPPAGYTPSSGKKLASLPADENAADCPVLLVTHMKVKAGKVADFYSYLGRKRDLVIYDESLFRSDSMAILWQDLDDAFGLASRRKLAPQSAEFFRTAEDALRAEVDRQGSEGPPPAVVRLENAPDDEGIEAIKADLTDKLMTQSNAASREAHALLSKLAEMSGSPMSISAAGHPDALLSFEPTIDDAVDRVAVLDASYAVRRLYDYDTKPDGSQGIQNALAHLGVIKRFDNVTLKFTRHASGRGNVQTDLAKGRDGFYAPYVASAINETPADKAVLIFTFGKRGECEANLRRALVDLGIDLDATLPDGSKRINVLPWGQETSRSDVKFCSVVVYCGVMYRSRQGINASIKGQARDLGIQTTSHEVRKVLASELVHAILQSAQRGSARDMTNGHAHSMTIYLPLHEHRAEVRRGLLDHMPGLRWENTADEVGEYAEAIGVHLASLPLELVEVSKQSVNVAVKKLVTFEPSRRAVLSAWCLWIHDLPDWTDGKTLTRR